MNGFMIVLLGLISILAGASFYLARRIFQGLVSFFPNLRFWPILLLMMVLTLFLVLGFGRSMLPFSKKVKYILGLTGTVGMGVFIYLLLFTVAGDLVTLVMRLMKLPITTHRFFRGYLTLAALILTVVTCVWGFVNSRQIDHVSYEIPLQDRQDVSDMKILLISDLHLGAVGSESRLEKVVEKINEQKPDVICIAGDFFDTDFASIKDPEKAIRTLRGLRATYGTYACLGNHDAGQTVPEMLTFLENANIQLLGEAYTVIDDRLVLIGRLDRSPIGGFGGRSRGELSDFFRREDPTLPVVVLDHNPARIDEYGSEADLILCGHTHRGQLFPANFITNCLFKVDYGHYQENSRSPHVVVTSGVGYWGMPMRVGTDCEIVTIRFRCN